MPIPNATARLWMCAVPAILTTINHARHDHLGGGPPGSASEANARAILQNSWGIHGESELAGMVQWLENSGSSAEYRELEAEILANPGAASKSPKHAFVAKYRGRLGKNALLAWDLCRVVSLVGWGARCGMISEETAWGWIAPSARRLQAAYKSWEDLGEGYTLGCAFWSAKHEQECRDAMAQLKADPASPWNTIAWKTNLDGVDSGEESEGGGFSMMGLALRGASCLLSLALAGVLGLFLLGVFGYIAWQIVANSPGGASVPDWDGATPLVCEGNERRTISGVTAKIADGAAITARANCQLTLDDVKIEAPVAVQAEGNAQVVVSGGRLAGTEAAVRAQGNSSVTMVGTEVVGTVDKARNATVTGP
jgi:hypothetical protein